MKIKITVVAVAIQIASLVGLLLIVVKQHRLLHPVPPTQQNDSVRFLRIYHPDKKHRIACQLTNFDIGRCAGLPTNDGICRCVQTKEWTIVFRP